MDHGDHYGKNVFEIIGANFQTVCQPGPNGLIEALSVKDFNRTCTTEIFGRTTLGILMMWVVVHDVTEQDVAEKWNGSF